LSPLSLDSLNQVLDKINLSIGPFLLS